MKIKRDERSSGRLGLQEMTDPVMRFMRLSGQFLPPSWRHPWQLLRWLITTGSLYTLTILSSVELARSVSSGFSSVIEIVTILLTLFEMCFRVAFLSRNYSRICALIADARSLPVTCPAFQSSEQTLRTRAMRLSRRTQRYIFGYVFIVLTGYLSLPFLPAGPDIFPKSSSSSSEITASIVNPARTRPLYLPMWLPQPLEEIQSPGYEILVIWQAWSFVVLVSVFCASDCLLYTFIIFVMEGLRHLKRAVPGGARVQRNKYQTMRLSVDPLAVWRKKADNETTFAERAEKEYRVWVQQHQFFLSLGEEVKALFSPIIMGTFFTNGTVLCVLAYVLVKLRNIVGILCVTGHFSCIVIKLYVMAVFGQILMDESKLLGMESVAKVWPRLGTKRRQDARIIGLRCCRGITLTGGGFFDLHVEIFGRVCSVALSYFIVLLQLY